MRSSKHASLLGALLLCGASALEAQQATERYIPIGRSPGISGAQSYIGEIAAVDRNSGTLTVVDASGRHMIRVTPQTLIWIDRNQRLQTNLVGNYEDCEVGRRVEIMHGRDDPTVALWIKVEIQ